MKNKGVIGIIILILFVIILGCIAFNADWLFGGIKDVNPKGEVLKLLINIIGGVILLLGVYFTYRRLVIEKKSRIDERFKIAVEHLASTKEPIILGGIAELFQIATENKKDYSETVLNIFCSYLRVESNLYENDVKSETGNKTIINYIFRKESKEIFLNSGFIIDLSETNLEYIEFYNLVLKNVSFKNSKLGKIKNCEFHNVDFSDAKFENNNRCNHKVDISGSKFYNCKFDYTKFIKIVLEDVDFVDNYGRCLQLFIKSKLCDVLFKNIIHDGSMFLECEIEGKKFEGKILNSDFSGSCIKNVFFDCENIFNCNFIGVIFYQVTVKNSKGCKFNGASESTGCIGLEKRLNNMVGRDVKEENIGVRFIDGMNNSFNKINYEDVDTILSYIKNYDLF